MEPFPPWLTACCYPRNVNRRSSIAYKLESCQVSVDICTNHEVVRTRCCSNIGQFLISKREKDGNWRIAVKMGGSPLELNSYSNPISLRTIKHYGHWCFICRGALISCGRALGDNANRYFSKTYRENCCFGILTTYVPRFISPLVTNQKLTILPQQQQKNCWQSHSSQTLLTVVN